MDSKKTKHIAVYMRALELRTNPKAFAAFVERNGDFFPDVNIEELKKSCTSIKTDVREKRHKEDKEDKEGTKKL